MVSRLERRRVDAERLEIGLSHFAARRGIEPLQGGAVLNRPPGRGGQLAAAFEPNDLTFRSLPRHRVFRAAGIRRAKKEARRALIDAAADDHPPGLG